jgi:uncharacterized membrane protein
MLKSALPLNLAGILLQFSPEITLLLAVAIVAVIVVVIVIVLLLLRRRTHPASGLHASQHHGPMFLHPTQSSSESSPTSTVLEMLRTDLDDASTAYASGVLDREEFDKRVSEIRTTLDDLKQIREVAPPPAPKSKKCNNCGAEIPVESQFCDRCGARQPQ